MTRSFIAYTLHQIKEDELGGACSMHGRDKNAYSILVGNLKGRDHLENLGLDGKIVLEGF
jgi:hypothetical protein